MKHTRQETLIDQGRVPPQALDLEEAVLGALMLFGDIVDGVLTRLRPEVFYKKAHQLIFKAIITLNFRGENIDELTVVSELRKSGELDLAGGVYGISLLSNKVTNLIMIDQYCLILIQQYIKREIIFSSNHAIKEAYEDTTDVFDMIDAFESRWEKTREIVTSGSQVKTMDFLVNQAMVRCKERENLYRQGRCVGIRTGLLDLDKKTGGWRNSDLIIMAGRPGMGKTAMMLFFALSAAESGVPVCIYSLEMAGVNLIDRLVMAVCNIDQKRFKSGAMREEDWQEINKAEKVLRDLPIYVDDNPVVSIRYIRSHAKGMKRKGKCGLILADYLQLADVSSGEKNRNREWEISQASRMAKITAKDLDVPFILLSQLNRECEKRNDKKPMLSDLRESGAIEQDADQVILVYRPAFYKLTGLSGEDLTGLGQLLIEKNREGSTGEVKFQHNESLTKITPYDQFTDRIP